MTASPHPRPLGEPPPAAEEPAERALRRLLRTQLEVLVAERPKLVAPSNAEPLHDFRVALRRARSLLKEMGDALPSRATGRLAEELEWLGTATGPSRDLDVMLAALDARRKDLPDWVEEGLNPLRSMLSERRAEAAAELARTATGERLGRLLDALAVLSERRPANARGPVAGHRPIGELAGERLAKAARRVVKRGKAIGTHSTAAERHRLRIACKRLRYLLEFFQPLYPPRTVAALIAALKRLQDLLGGSNDLEVEARQLRVLARQVPAVEAVLAVGFLLAALETEQQQLETQFRPALRAFLGRHNQERLRRLTRAEEPR